MEHKPRIIATVINDVLYDQRMIRICTSLAKDYKVALWGRRRFSRSVEAHPYTQRRFRFLINNGPLFYLFYNIRLFFALLFTKTDIIHSVDLDTLPAGFLAAKLKNCTLVYDSHEYFTEVPELVHRPLKQKMWLKIEQFFVPRLKNAMTVGQMIANEYKQKYQVDFAVIRNAPVLLAEDLDQKQESTPYLLYPGALNKGRGLEACIEAMLQLENLNLKIAGTGDLEDELKELTLNLGLTERVHFLGMLTRDEMRPLVASAFLGLNVSENLGMSYYLSLNNKYFDFIHGGLPAITNAFPEYMQLNDRFDCCLFANAKADDIAQKVKLLQNDTEHYQRLKKNCFLARQELNWQREELALNAFYAKLK